MLARNSIRAHFTVAGQELPVTQFSLEEAISKPTELHVSLALGAHHQCQKPAQFLNQPVHFHLQDEQGHERHWHLRCEKAEFTGEGLILLARSAWAACFYSQHSQRVFCNHELPELVDSILMAHGLPKSYASWHLSHQAWQRDKLVQVGQSDGEFIQLVCGRENIQCFSRFDEQKEVLHFIDNPRFLEPRAEPLLDFPRGSLVDCERIQRGPLTPKDYAQDRAFRLYSGIACLEAGRKSEGMSIKSYQPLSYQPGPLKEALRARQILAQDLPPSGYSALRFKSNLLDLAPGLLVQYQGAFHLNYVLHSGNSTQGQELLLYQNQVILQSAQSPWRGILPKAQPQPLVFQGSIVKSEGLETLEGFQEATPIPRLTPYADSRGGLYFPLDSGAEVLLSCLYGEPDLPLVLGTVFNQEKPSPVNRSNPWVNLIQTHQGQKFCLDDTPSDESITLSTHSGHSFVMNQQKKPGIFVTCIGGMLFESLGQQTWHLGETFKLWAGETYSQQAKVGQLIQSENKSIHFNLPLNLQLHALEQIQLHALRHARIFCKNTSLNIKQGQSISVKQGDAHLVVQGAQKVEVSQDIQIKSLAGNLIWMNQAGNAGMKLTQAGTITVFGKRLLLSTDMQKHAATIHHS